MCCSAPRCNTLRDLSSVQVLQRRHAPTRQTRSQRFNNCVVLLTISNNKTYLAAEWLFVCVCLCPLAVGAAAAAAAAAGRSGARLRCAASHCADNCHCGHNAVIATVAVRATVTVTVTVTAMAALSLIAATTTNRNIAVWSYSFALAAHRNGNETSARSVGCLFMCPFWPPSLSLSLWCALATTARGSTRSPGRSVVVVLRRQREPLDCCSQYVSLAQHTQTYSRPSLNRIALAPERTMQFRSVLQICCYSIEMGVAL